MQVGDTFCPLYAAIIPSNVTGTVIWQLGVADKDCFEIIELPDKSNCIALTCIGALPGDVNCVYLYASLYGQETKCLIHVVS